MSILKTHIALTASNLENSVKFTKLCLGYANRMAELDRKVALSLK
nr:hypothetical protein [Okeania sp. SIO2F4]